MTAMSRAQLEIRRRHAGQHTAGVLRDGEAQVAVHDPGVRAAVIEPTIASDSAYAWCNGSGQTIVSCSDRPNVGA
ncbi:hypothetical protein [Kutzneria kofuensis]|uniref:hypothetical protein n=1 Tax=Kutzneria kofuensis TaxID=103725 RepID=UPI0031E51A0D